MVATPDGVVPSVDMMSLRPSMAGGEKGALELEAIIRSAEVMRRPLELSDVRLEDYDAVYLPGGHGPKRSASTSAAARAGSPAWSRIETWSRDRTPHSAAVLGKRLLEVLAERASGRPGRGAPS